MTRSTANKKTRRLSARKESLDALIARAETLLAEMSERRNLLRRQILLAKKLCELHVKAVHDPATVS